MTPPKKKKRKENRNSCPLKDFWKIVKRWLGIDREIEN